MAWKPTIRDFAIVQDVSGVAQENGHEIGLSHIISHSELHCMADDVLATNLTDTLLALTHTHLSHLLRTYLQPLITSNTTTAHLDNASCASLLICSLLSLGKA